MAVSRRVYKWLGLVVIFAVLFPALTLAQDETAQEDVTPEPTLAPAEGAVELQYWDMQWGNPIFMAAMQNLVTEFNRTHPEIHVSFQQLSWGDYMQKILAAVEAGNPPDISGGDSGIAFNMAAQDQALDISDLYKEWEADGTLADMTEWAYKKWDWNGMHPGVTWQFDSRVIYYRKDLFEAAGIAVPTTWDEWLAAAKALHKPDEGVAGMALPAKQGSYDTDQFWMTLVLQAGGAIADEQGKLTINSPENLAALKFEKEMVDCCTARGTAAWSMTEVLRAYEQGQAAMAFGGGWYIADMQRNAPDIFAKTGVLPVLIGPGGPEAQHIVSFANPWMIYKQSKHPEEAKTFLRWMMRPENLGKLYEAEPGAKWPVYKSLLQAPVYQSNELIAEVARQTVENGVDYWYPNNAGAVGIGSMGTSLTDIIVNPVVTGSRSPEDALADAQEQLAPLFEQQGG
ncbi:MAG TPA: sugar ABC transporter substrate-binding protein [Thermomicrobiales bacterium]|nr:sugar ABC transporter substrate-binding protein [Thermomicrobiales bacterium]